MFERVKRSIVRKRVYNALTSREYDFLQGGIKTTGAKIGDLFGKTFIAMSQSVFTVLETDPEKTSELISDLYGPTMEIAEALEKSMEIGKEHSEFIKSIGKEFIDKMNAWDSELDTNATNIAEDLKTIAELAKDIFKKHLS